MDDSDFFDDSGLSDALDYTSADQSPAGVLGGFLDPSSSDGSGLQSLGSSLASGLGSTLGTVAGQAAQSAAAGNTLNPTPSSSSSSTTTPSTTTIIVAIAAGAALLLLL